MKMIFKGLVVGCMALLCAGVIAVPNAQCSIRDCLTESGIDTEAATQEEMKAAIQACAEQAGAERDARIDEAKEEISTRIDEARTELEARNAEKKAEREARMAEMQAAIDAKTAEAKAKLEEIKAKIEERKAMHDAFGTCMDEVGLDPETVTEAILEAAIEDCARTAGVDVDAIQAAKDAKIAEMVAIKAAIDAKKAELEAKIAEMVEKKAIIDECMETSTQGLSPSEIGLPEMKDIVNGCLLEAGIDIEAKKQEIKDKIADDMNLAEGLKTCLHVIDFEGMDKEAAKAEIEDCLMDFGIGIE